MFEYHYYDVVMHMLSVYSFENGTNEHSLHTSNSILKMGYGYSLIMSDFPPNALRVKPHWSSVARDTYSQVLSIK